MLKNQPCAYCGSTNVPRTKGHVLPANLYPDSMPNVQRITVAECETCKALWEDAEPHFRNILLAMWNPDTLPVDSRVDAMWRGFREADGKRRRTEILELIKPVGLASQRRKAIYPVEDDRFNLVLRRIVRGLAAKHQVAHAIPDEAVTCGPMLWEVPPAFKQEFQWHEVAPEFFCYAYATNLDSMHSFWLLRFSRHLLFFGAVESDKGNA